MFDKGLHLQDLLSFLFTETHMSKIGVVGRRDIVSGATHLFGGYVESIIKTIDQNLVTQQALLRENPFRLRRIVEASTVLLPGFLARTFIPTISKEIRR